MTARVGKCAKKRSDIKLRWKIEKERQTDVSEKVKPSSEILYKKLEEGFISMVCTRICEALINANRLYNFGPGQNQYIPPIPAIEIGIHVPATNRQLICINK